MRNETICAHCGGTSGTLRTVSGLWFVRALVCQGSAITVISGAEVYGLSK